MISGMALIFGIFVIWIIYKRCYELRREAEEAAKKALKILEEAKAEHEVAALFRRDAIKLFREAKRIHRDG